MNTFSSYIDRQKSGLGSSEKSQKVHSANWKEEIQLKKELECLRKHEQQRVCRLSSDQRLVVDRFYRKLSRSVDIAKKHEKIKEALPRNRNSRQQKYASIENVEKHMRQIRCLSAFPKPPVPKFRTRQGRAASCEPTLTTENNARNGYQEFTEPQDLPPRPMTSLEKSNKMWEKQLNSVTQRINRARSAPARPAYYKVPEFTKSTESGNRDRKSPKQRAKTAVELNVEVYRKLRERELERQNEAVKVFLKTIDRLELVPWTPFDAETNTKDTFNIDDVLQTRKHNASQKQSKTKTGHGNDILDSEQGPTKAWT